MTKETKELRRTYWALLTAFALLVAMGMANVFSATFVSDGVHGRFFNHLMRQAFFSPSGWGRRFSCIKKITAYGGTIRSGLSSEPSSSC